MTAATTNWAGTHIYAGAVARPESVGALQELVAAATAQGRRVRALGTRHSFNDVADVDGVLVDTTALPAVVEPAHDAGDGSSVVVGAGVTYAVLAERLHAAGLALHNLASLPHISVAGAVMTGTHGSGDANAGLAGAVTAVELLTADGSLRWITIDDADFEGVVVSLGRLGIATRLRLATEPTFAVRQYVFEGIGARDAADSLEELLPAAYSVSVFTDWTRAQVWVKSRDGDGFVPRDRWLGGTASTVKRHPILGADPVHCTDQGGVPGPWHERLPHFRPGFTPSSGDEIQSEYLVPRVHAADAMRALASMADRIAPVLHVSEVRSIRADRFWLSGAYERGTVGLHFTWKRMPDDVAPVRLAVEAALRPFSPRPHWGKVSSIPTDEVAAAYPRLADVRGLVRRTDPTGTFANRFTDALLAT